MVETQSSGACSLIELAKSQLVFVMKPSSDMSIMKTRAWEGLYEYS